MDKLLYTKKPVKPPRRRKESRYVQFVRRLGKAWGGKGAWREAKRRVWFNIFVGFLNYFIFIFSFKDSGRDIVAFHA